MQDDARRLTIRWDDPIAAYAAGKGLSGLEWMQKLVAGEIAPPPIMKLLGYELLEVSAGRAVFSITPGEQHYNPIGVVHGGVAMTLLDSAMSLAVHTTLAAGSGYTTLEAKIHLVRAVTVKTGRLRAIGSLVHGGARVATAEGHLVDDADRLYAHGTTTCIVLADAR